MGNFQEEIQEKDLVFDSTSLILAWNLKDICLLSLGTNN